MKFGFLKVAAATPEISVANCEKNTEEILRLINITYNMGAKFIVFPELCITGYTCGDLFLQDVLLSRAEDSLKFIAEKTTDIDAPIIIGLPFIFKDKLYNCAAVLLRGNILGIVPKTYIANYTEYYEARYFSSGNRINGEVEIGNSTVPFGTDIVFTCKNLKNFTFAVEICEDLWAVKSPSENHVLAGAMLIANLSASNENVGKRSYRKSLVTIHSGKCICGYVFASAGMGESSTDLVYSGHNIISEHGTVLSETFGLDLNNCVGDNIAISEIDLDRLAFDRRRVNTFIAESEISSYRYVSFETEIVDCALTRNVSSAPFIPSDICELNLRCEEILNIQTAALIKRLNITNAKTAVVNVSGGLDSTLTLLVAYRAVNNEKCNCKNITAITIPGPGTTERTFNNATQLIKILGAKLITIQLENTLTSSFKDLGHDENIHDVTYENTQARLRMTIGMNMANKEGGILLGTSDLSELALGWTTYAGDHMSMYNVNSSVPKTLIRHIISHIAQASNGKELCNVLNYIISTPVSPELIPSKTSEIEQRTEDIVGPYKLHDFFLYYAVRFAFSPQKIKHLALYAFKDEFSEGMIDNTLKLFYSRFFNNQFKRSCVPDGVKIGSVSLSPRSDLRMPSDADSSLWLKNL